ncbi:hypothetical protein QFC22_000707 [Naganishia vaughanmartiniae]|uniref:Uncharacterized protein n=1 Tax=Naganishia vaughanmartiniae TaxID=1424756 RepID=A0ACC2XMI6_9TREE|nr:hypothetical protein QFC22_000707 [Naganishia vaughanmartiniae]
MVGSTSRTVAPGDKHAMQAPSPPTSPLDRKTSRPWTSPANETSGSFSKGTQHRRRLSSNQERGKPTANKSEAKPSRSQGESSAKRKEQSEHDICTSLRLKPNFAREPDRIAQRAFRKRQKAHLEELEAEVIEKGSRIKEITENNGVLLETMKQLQSQNIEMKHSRVPTELGYQLPFLTATGTPLTSELGRNKNGEDRTALDINRHRRGRDVRHGRTDSNSENSQSSSSETRDSTVSSPEILSPVILQGASVVRTPHMGSLTGLQLNLQPSAESTSYPTPISASHSFQSLRDGSFSHMGYTFAPPDNFPKQPDGHQQWMSFGAVQQMPPTYQHGFTVPGQHLGPGQHFSPPGHQPSQHPGQSYQTLPPPPIRRNSEALTHHHVRSLGSLTDFNSMHGSMSTRPHTSTSTSRGPSKMGESRPVSMSVPTSTRHLPDGDTEEEMLLSRAFPTSPSQPVPVGPASTKRAAPQHLTYQRPTHAYSASASNIGLSFSPISPPNLLGRGDIQYDYARSSAPYFSNLSIQPQSTLDMEMGRSPPQDHYDHDHSGSSRDGWADMMPSMGATTPLQELNHKNSLDTVGSEPPAIEQYRNHSLSSSEQAFSPEPSIFSLTGLDLAGGLEFPFAPMQMFSSPPETR